MITQRSSLLAAAIVALTLVAASFADGADAADRVYWGNYSSLNSISYANLDGSDEGGNLDLTGSDPANVGSLGIDMAQNRVYWSGGYKISYADLSSGEGGELSTGAAPLSVPNGIAIDPAAGRIYWANQTSNEISYARLDGSGGGAINTAGATASSTISVAVDPAVGRIYWANAGSVNKISYANLDGSGGADLNTTGATVDNPQGVAIDPAAGRIYWANVYGQKISYANLDGSGGGDLNTAGATVSNPVGVAVDVAVGRVYWGSVLGQKVSYARLDGSGGADLDTTGASPNGPSYPVLLKAPVGAGAPEVTTTKQGLSCSQGSWAPDLVASFVYRSPGSFSYRWSVGGTEIPGATTSTYSPAMAVPATPFGGQALSPPSEYRCTVTASNPAGTATQTSAPFVVAPSSMLLVRPVLTRLAINPRGFLAKGKGANVSYFLNEAASVAFKVQRRLPGRRGKGGKCVKAPRATQGKPKCLRLVGVSGGFAQAGAAGENSFRFNGRIAGKKLKPGGYVLLATPSASGVSGDATRADFRIKRPPRPNR